MEKQFDFVKKSNQELLHSGLVQYDYNLFYEKKRFTPLQENIQICMFSIFMLIMLSILTYDTYNMYDKIKDKEIVSTTIEENVIKLLPMHIEINRMRNK